MKNRHLISGPYTLPYNPELTTRAKKMRQNMTAAERKIWFGLLSDFKYKVMRQKIIDNYIVDFYIPKLKLIIEIDGASHFTKEGLYYDHIRTAVLESYNLKILRFTNNEIVQNFKSVCSIINCFHNIDGPESPLSKGGGQRPGGSHSSG